MPNASIDVYFSQTLRPSDSNRSNVFRDVCCGVCACLRICYGGILYHFVLIAPCLRTPSFCYKSRVEFSYILLGVEFCSNAAKSCVRSQKHKRSLTTNAHRSSRTASSLPLFKRLTVPSACHTRCRG